MRQLLINILAVTCGACFGIAVGAAILGIASVAVTSPAMPDVASPGRLLAFVTAPDAMPYPAILLAHASGTLSGAALAAWLAASHALLAAMAVGFVFMTAGIATALSLPAPDWFDIIHLNLVFVPMAWLGWRLGRRLKRAPRAGHTR
ncbi:hypothetical protein [Pseudoduganella lutea]|uniref:Uncharacterized protein n=1 Tax=Pseudoduganella lutea TaxID=321985 RepID=A0A4P6L4U0_9BURK|nr:hypothetical protein [Pseudoduganella lutea]QBE65918.1 hypothetical protein EWM63_25465 [Pseudoduganella lutea]